MDPLNFPAYQVRTKVISNKMSIFDSVRRKYVALTPEEWVRQHLINYLVTEKKCPISLISVETPLKYVQMNKRSDVIVYGRNGQPLLLAECKAPEVNITQKVFEQITIYNLTIHAPYLMVTNGLQHYCLSSQAGEKPACFLREIPDYQTLVRNTII